MYSIPVETHGKTNRQIVGEIRDAAAQAVEALNLDAMDFQTIAAEEGAFLRVEIALPEISARTAALADQPEPEPEWLRPAEALTPLGQNGPIDHAWSLARKHAQHDLAETLTYHSNNLRAAIRAEHDKRGTAPPRYLTSYTDPADGLNYTILTSAAPGGYRFTIIPPTPAYPYSSCNEGQPMRPTPEESLAAGIALCQACDLKTLFVKPEGGI